MYLDVIKAVKQTESEADKIIKEAIAESQRIVSEAKAKSEKLLEEAILKAEKESEKILEAAKESAQKDIIKLQADTDAECNELKNMAMSCMDEAVQLVIRRVVTAHGNC